jgi:hypothetical protein
MTKREKWIAEFKISKAGKAAIEELKELEDERGPDGIKDLRDKILEACYLANYYERDNDFYEISRKMDRESRKIKPLLECIKTNKILAKIKANHFLFLLNKKGITFHGDDSIAENDLAKMLEIIVESLCESPSSLSGDPCSVVGNIDYSKDLTEINQRANISIMGLILELRLLIEKWLNIEKWTLLSGVSERDKLSRRSDKDSKNFMHYKIVSLFVNAALNENYSAEAIKNKLKKHLDSNPNTGHGRYIITD